MRALPTDQVNALTKTNFKTYSPISCDAEGDIISNVDVSGIVTKSFSIKASDTSASGQSYFSLVQPYNGQSVCVGGTSMDLPIEYILQNTKDKLSADEIYKLDYSITSSQYIFDNSKNSIEISHGHAKEVKMPITLPSNLKSDVSQWVADSSTINYVQSALQTVEEHLLGSIPIAEMTLSYNVYKGNKNELTANEEYKYESNPAFSDNFKFYLNIGCKGTDTTPKDNGGTTPTKGENGISDRG